MNNMQCKPLSLDAVRVAREAMKKRLSAQGERMKMQFDFEIVPPPQKEGEILNAYNGEFVAVAVNGVLRWQATGRHWADELFKRAEEQ